jgi:hypothetical protein
MKTQQRLRDLYWSLAIARKLLDTARRERRWSDANYYAKCVEADELRATELLQQRAQRCAP